MQGNSKNDLKFEVLHHSMFRSKGLFRQHLVPDKLLAASPWFAVLLDREQACFVWQLRHDRDAPNGKVLTAVDVSQRIHRLVVVLRDNWLPTLTPSSKLWLATCCEDPGNANHSPERVLLGVESLAAQGFPTAIRGRDCRATQPHLQELAGKKAICRSPSACRS